MNTVYIDVLFCTNLIINYFIILSTAVLNRMTVHRLRYILGAMLGAVYSLFIFLPDLGITLNLIAKLAFSVSIIMTAFGRCPIKQFLRLLSVFYGASFALCGIMIGVYLTLKPEQMVISNGVVYFDISPSMLILSVSAFYVIFSLIGRYVKRKAPAYSYVDIEIGTEMGSIMTVGMIDTGNTLSDIFTDSPIVLLAYDTVKNIIPVECRDAFKNASLENAENLTGKWSSRYRLIPFTSAGGTGLLPAFRPSYFYIRRGNGCLLVKDVLIAVSQNIKGEERAIVNPKVLENVGSEAEKCLKV